MSFTREVPVTEIVYPSDMTDLYLAMKKLTNMIESSLTTQQLTMCANYLNNMARMWKFNDKDFVNPAYLAFNDMIMTKINLLQKDETDEQPSDQS